MVAETAPNLSRRLTPAVKDAAPRGGLVMGHTGDGPAGTSNDRPRHDLPVNNEKFLMNWVERLQVENKDLKARLAEMEGGEMVTVRRELILGVAYQLQENGQVVLMHELLAALGDKP
jgi:hypothetical protein